MSNLLNNGDFYTSVTPASTAAEEFLTIGQMASEFNVSLRTLRFYEDRRLLSPLRHGTMRLYDHRQRARLQMILKGKRLGFTLTEIGAMLGTAAREEPEEIENALAPDKIVSQIDALERQRQVLDAAIRELRATHQKLQQGGVPGIAAGSHASVSAA
jgi:DNA-binding transcriptional MerR regulator